MPPAATGDDSPGAAAGAACTSGQTFGRGELQTEELSPAQSVRVRTRRRARECVPVRIAAAPAGGEIAERARGQRGQAADGRTAECADRVLVHAEDEAGRTRRARGEMPGEEDREAHEVA